MSTLKADTIQSTSGGAATLTKQNGAKAFTFSGDDASSFAVNLNISSGIDEGTGDYIHNFTNAFSTSVDEGQGTGATCAGGARGARIATSDTTSTAIGIQTENFSDGANADSRHSFVICGDLA